MGSENKIFLFFCSKMFRILHQFGVIAVAIFSLFENANSLTYCDNNCASPGYFCIADDPTAFSVCGVGYRAGTMHCQTGLWFDSYYKVCNWPSAVQTPQCPCPQATPPPTTSSPTSTASTGSTLSSTSATSTISTATISTAGSTTGGSTTGSTAGSSTISTTTISTTGGSTAGSTATSTATSTLPPSPPTGLRRVCYYTNWAVYRSGPGSYWAGNVDPFMCTHIIVAFMNLNDAQISYLDTSDSETLSILTKLRDIQNPHLKIMAAIGGWNAGSWPFITTVSSTDTQDSFVSQAISFLRKNNLDGLDVDWEYPQGYVPQFTLWMQKLQSAFAYEASQTGRSRLLLSAAVSAGQSTIDWSYNVPKLSAAVDMLNLMSYDLNGAWNPTTGLNSGLYPQTSTDPFNIAWCSSYWVQKGADPSKLNIGIPTYGRTFKLCNPGPTQTKIGSKACGTGTAGPYTASDGFEAYYESCLKLQCTVGNWTSVWSDAGQAPYMYSGNQWISYENSTSIAAKVNYVKSNNYGGVMVWALDLDDFHDVCGFGVKSPLMSTLVAAATNQPLPVFNAVPSPAVNPCDPLNTGASGSTSEGASGTGTPSGTSVNLSICDNNCAVDGLYCVPDNIYAFYQCLSGFRYPLQYCSSSLNYNYIAKACDWPANYPGCNCVIPSTTTKAASTTTTASTTTSSAVTSTSTTEQGSTSVTTDATTDASTSILPTESTSCLPATTESSTATSTDTTQESQSTTSTIFPPTDSTTVLSSTAATSTDTTQESQSTTSTIFPPTDSTTVLSSTTAASTDTTQESQSTSTILPPADSTIAPTDSPTTDSTTIESTSTDTTQVTKTTTGSPAIRRFKVVSKVKKMPPLCISCNQF